MFKLKNILLVFLLTLSLFGFSSCGISFESGDASDLESDINEIEKLPEYIYLFPELKADSKLISAHKKTNLVSFIIYQTKFKNSELVVDEYSPKLTSLTDEKNECELKGISKYGDLNSGELKKDTNFKIKEIELIKVDFYCGGLSLKKVFKGKLLFQSIDPLTNFTLISTGKIKVKVY